MARRPEDPESSDALGTDWLLLGVPLGSLARVWPEVAPYPFLDRDEEMTSQIAWQERIEAFLVSVAADLHARLPFGFGAIGHDLVA